MPFFFLFFPFLGHLCLAVKIVFFLQFSIIFNIEARLCELFFIFSAWQAHIFLKNKQFKKVIN